jgi:cytochrome c-type biogenesis protein CcmH/NrfG
MKGERMKTYFRPMIIALLAFPAAVLAAGGGDTNSSEAAADPVIAAAQEANGRKDYAKSSEILRDALAKAPGNADYHNLYAYSVRKGANPNMDVVFKHYNEALRINPKHRGAHEYIGEAYLMVGNVGKAKEHLSQLDSLCFFPCGEYSDLKKAVAEYEAKRK